MVYPTWHIHYSYPTWRKKYTFTDYFPRLYKVHLQHISSVIALTIALLDKVVKKIYIFQQLVQKRIVIFSNYYQMSVLIFLVHFVLEGKILPSKFSVANILSDCYNSYITSI